MFWGILGVTLACAWHLLVPTTSEGAVEGQPTIIIYINFDFVYNL